MNTISRTAAASGRAVSRALAQQSRSRSRSRLAIAPACACSERSRSASLHTSAHLTQAGTASPAAVKTALAEGASPSPSHSSAASPSSPSTGSTVQPAQTRSSSSSASTSSGSTPSPSKSKESSTSASVGGNASKRTDGFLVIEGVEEDDAFSGLTPEELDESKGEVNFSLARPPHHEPKHGHLVCKLVLSCNAADLASLSFYTQFCVHAAYAFGLVASRPGAIPVKTSLRTVPRSPFVHKPSQENFVKKTHSRYIKIYDGSPEMVDSFLTYLTENGMGGVRMKAQTWERVPIGFGRDMLPDGLALEDTVTTEAKVKALAEQLVKNGLGAGEEARPTVGGQVKQAPEATPAS